MHTQDVPDIVASWDEATTTEFYSYIDIDEDTGCWLWTGRTQRVHKNLYPLFYCTLNDETDTISAKMLTYELEVKGGLPIKAGHETIVRRQCDQTLCVNPDHQTIFHRSHKKNSKAARKKKSAKKQDWCEAGLHNLNVPGNRTSDGSQCRQCHNKTRRQRVADMSDEELQARRERKRQHDRERAERWPERAVERLKAM